QTWSSPAGVFTATPGRGVPIVRPVEA
ncbi:MAG: hypothetical protein QOD86_2687, partial [Miltoncostaeaceae bacterium]|nr:hypothetical protein [Miltoncostaeaceae bacterium]